MKSVAIADAKRSLADYAREAQHQTLVITRRGRPMAAIVPIRDIDLESLAVSSHPDFITLIARARARFRKTGGIPFEDVKRRRGADQAPGKLSRRAARSAASKRARRAQRRAFSR